jgi:tripartite-type tricarboxylate transporter receptor subunit TctC
MRSIHPFWAVTRTLMIGVGALVAAQVLAAETYPSRPLRVVVPYSAGGGVDITARLLAEPLRNQFGQGIVVDNRPGASGMIGAGTVAKASPDGYTLLLSAAGEIAVNPHLYKRMSYNPDKELTPISLVVRIPNVLVVNNDVPAKNIQGLIAFAKKQAGAMTYSSSGIGNPQHLSGEMLEKMTGIKMNHIPMKGAAQQLTDVAGKHVHMTFSSIAAARPYISGGRVRPIAVTGKSRVAAMPDVPALSEYKPLEKYELINWFGLFVPAGAPQAIVSKLNDAVVSALKSPDMVRRYNDQGMEPAPMTSKQASDFVKSESGKFAQIIREADVQLQ